MRARLSVLLAACAMGCAHDTTEPLIAPPTGPSFAHQQFDDVPGEGGFVCVDYGGIIYRHSDGAFGPPCETGITIDPPTSNGSIVMLPGLYEPKVVSFSRPVSHLLISAFAGLHCGDDPGSVVAHTVTGETVSAPFEPYPRPSGQCGDVITEAPVYQVQDAVGFMRALVPGDARIDRIVIMPPGGAREWDQCRTYVDRDPPQTVCIRTHAVAFYLVAFREWPAAEPEVRIRSLTGGFDVRPEGTGGNATLTLEVGAFDDNGNPLPDRQIDLSLTATEGTAGHAHAGSKPAGTLSQNSVSTGPGGTSRIVFAAPQASGPVTVRATSIAARAAVATIKVGVGGLVALAAGTSYALIGGRDEHPDNHYGSVELNSALTSLADSLAEYAARIPGLPVSERPRGRFPSALGVNDMSLEQGGIFDLGANWQAPHGEHWLGTEADVDVRRSSEDDDYAEYVRLIWETKLGFQIGDERASRNHFHLRL